MSAKHSEPKNHHYHPQFLMRGHCFDKKRQKTFYAAGDNPVTEKKIKSLFCERHGYSRIRDNWARGQPGASKKWDASTENYLNQKVEDPTSKLIRRIRRAFEETQDLVFESTEEEKALLVRFFQVQFQRQDPDAMQEQADEAIRDGLEATRLTHSDDEDWPEFERVVDANPDYFQRLVTCEFLGDVENLHPQDFNDLMRSRVSLVQTTTHLPQKHLISGRKPIVPFWSDLSDGRVREGNQFIMAVSHNMGIVLETCWRPSNWIYLCRENLPLNEVTKLNDRMYLFSEGEIIGRGRDLVENVRTRNRSRLLEILSSERLPGGPG